MKKTINVEKLLNRIDNEINIYKGYIKEESSENTISRNLEKIKERESHIFCYGRVIIGLEKAEEIILNMQKF